MIQAAIVGGGGYTAGELIRILLYHPKVQLAWVHSNSQHGKPIYHIHEDLVGETDLHFTNELGFSSIDVLFLCSGHGQSARFLQENTVPEKVAVVDLSHDFRLDEAFVYGLPELNKAQIQNSKRIANCGCFATCIQLGLLPLAKAGLLKNPVNITAITGATGAGQSPGATTHFSWRNNNLSVYKAFGHQHLAEIKRSLRQLQGPELPPIHFVPMRGDFTRGIFASMYTVCTLSESEVYQLFEDYYQDAAYTKVVRQNPNLKQVVNTNRALVYLEKHGDQLLILSLIDNLLKGASGQAVQNMNLIFGFPETTGLQLKAMVF